jgi:hypothetical protein
MRLKHEQEIADRALAELKRLRGLTDRQSRIKGLGPLVRTIASARTDYQQCDDKHQAALLAVRTLETLEEDANNASPDWSDAIVMVGAWQRPKG